MTKPSISITELEDWQQCSLLHHFKYGLRLRPPTDEINYIMLSGRAIHFGVESAILRGRDTAVDAATTFLAQYGDVGERFINGVQTALAGIPDWVFEVPTPQVEAPIEVEYQDVIVRGRPDLWWYDGDSIHIVDFKSTSKDEVDKLARYQMWNMQPRRYGVLVRDSLNRPFPVYTRHIMLSTRGKHIEGRPLLLTEPLLVKVQREMQIIAWQIAVQGTEAPPHYGSHCGFCDYNTICEVQLTGGNIDDIIRTWQNN